MPFLQLHKLNQQPFSKHASLVSYSLFHFLIDLSCIYFLTGLMTVRITVHEKWLLLAVFYNLLAFALPLVLGLLSDLLDQNTLFAAFGFFCIFSGYILYQHEILAVTLLGLGNGCFHIGGGRQILQDHPCDYRASGIFISTGALGVFFGTVWGLAHLPLWKLFRELLLLCGVCLLGQWLLFQYMPHEVLRKGSPDFSTHSLKNAPFVPFVHTCHFQSRFARQNFNGIFFALLSVVCIRSYYGMLLSYSWKNGFAISLIFALCIIGGKMSGGILADFLGVRITSILSLGAAGILALFSFVQPICGCLSVFFFNMTMPLTLALMAQQFPGYPGFAFGALMFALFLGTLPTMLGGFTYFFTPWGLCLLCFLSLLLLLRAVPANNQEECL